ncbi:MAG: hypothetical protein WBG50_10030 [Desulfomonilaceae bacterium]
MNNDKGYAVVIVLLFLGVISLLGVGLMEMSRLDLQFTGAIKNYNKLFNLADGACGMAFNDMKTGTIADPGYTGAAGLSSGPVQRPFGTNPSDADSTSPLPNPSQYPFPGKEGVYGQSPTATGASIGKYYALETIQGYDDSAKDQPGWGQGQGDGGAGYHMEYWTGTGYASRNQGTMAVESAVLKHVQN